MNAHLEANKIEGLAHALKMPQTLLKVLEFMTAGLVIFFLCTLLQVTPALSLFLLVTVIYVRLLYKKGMGEQPYCMLNLTLLYVIGFVTSYLIIKQVGSLFFIPFCFIPMLATVLFGEMVISFILSVVLAVSVAAISGNNLYLAVIYFISANAASFLVIGARKRNTILQAGIVVGLIQVFALFLVDGMHLVNSRHYLILLSNGIICGILVLGVLPIFEFLFKTITNISLLELADFNHPILNRLMLEAPGTYHHSLIVGNLSDAACSVVGANSLLARIGAYYHDIGKIQKPEYFSENQGCTENKHDALSPSMSKLVIMNHVKDGVELATKYRLNPRIIDFIQFHHGNSLVYYFYRRALESSEEEREISEEGFRYPGPRPNTRETAIMMLADSVEAAARTLKDPTPTKIEELVRKIINNKFIDGQLDECELTLKDIEKISVVFIRILSGIYHSRIHYPDEKKEAN